MRQKISPAGEAAPHAPWDKGHAEGRPDVGMPNMI